MLLADHGAQVTKIEPPGGDPTRALCGAQVWHRGKRSAVLDLHDAADRERVARARRARRRARRELRARHRRAARHRPRDAARAQPAPRVLLDHRVRRRRRARRPARGRRARRRAHRPPVGEPRRARRHARRAWPGSRRRSPTSSCPTTAGWPRRVRVRCSPGVPWVSIGVGLPRHARDQRRAARARADRPRAARVDVAVPGRARHHALGVAARRARRHPELPELDQRPARAEGRVPLRRRPLDPPVGAAPRLRHQRGRGRPRAAHREDHPPRRRDHAHRDGRQRDAAAAPLPTADGRGDRQVPVGAVGASSAPRSACRCSRCGRRRRRCTTPRSSPTAA